MARPRKEIDKKTFEGLCGIQCTQEEICDVFDITDKTLNTWCKRTYGKVFPKYLRKNGILEKYHCVEVDGNWQRKMPPSTFSIARTI